MAVLIGSLGSVGMWSVVVALPAVQSEFAAARGTASLAFTLGVVPLYLAVGAGAEMRIALGTAVFWGMIGVTLFGLIFTPVFYVVIRRLTGTKMVVRCSGASGAMQPAE